MRWFAVSAILASQVAFAALNEPCYGANGVAGVCVSTATCSSNGGVTSSGGCPRDPADVKCCAKPTCGASPGNCRWSSDCAGSSLSGLCPGPSGFKCCQSSATGFGGYAAPKIPAVGPCKQVSVDGAKRVVAQFPGRIRDIGCVRACDCSASGASDHCCGKAVDLMCSDVTETASIGGKAIAEWIMNNQASLKVKYIIWGQRIWNPSQDAVKAWSSWRTMEDRGNVRENHW
ncbi:D-alanyl-D-alanine carboxypeptidase [Sporormia fimetaria CBS 119925]|uniref:D-alanyl-D-alanine carboxypeptidase n=1 Tax=Sporormia fimetaria CBS 119925 TaxID=1340428 RepID=A0A6A6VQ11_9PLEO|nr:D-alanyl-D-alanine carboxypeptidase [Sporormia fimetaria CBS 119925]